MKNIKISFLFSVVLVLLFETVFSISVDGQQIIHGNVPKAIARLGIKPIGQMDTTHQLSFTIGLPLRNEAALKKRLHQIYDPASPMFHHYQTVEQFTAEFGPTESDYHQVISFCKANGLIIIDTTKNRMTIEVRGEVGKIERAFHVILNRYMHPNKSRMFFAPDRKPTLDLKVPILRIEGLSNFYHTRPVSKKNIRIPKASNTSSFNGTGSGPGGDFIGYDFRDAYAPNATLTGTGQTVALLQFDGYSSTDITNYESEAGLPNVPLQNVLLGGFTGNPSGQESEVCLDIEMAISMAPGLSKVMVYESPPDSVGYAAAWDYMLSKIASDDIAKQISSSWTSGGPADSQAEQVFMEMADQGQSFFQASGDSDAWTGQIPFPVDSPNITIVGGTFLTTNGPGGSYKSERVWNKGYVYLSGYVGSGGGISTQYSIPTWQQNVDMSNNQGSTTMRNIPDVAMVADSIDTRVDGADYSNGGTSAAAPLWAGFMALVNEQAANDGFSPIGFLNPSLYSIGEGNVYTDCFHDITTGNNEWPNSSNKFSTVSGYDLCTGWGTPHGQALINYLVASDMPSVPASITSNTTLSSKYYKASQFITVSNGATLTISQGVNIYLEPNIGIIVKPGSKIVVNGSSGNPDKFLRLDPNSSWNIIYLQGNGNQFNWTLFDGGYEDVDIESAGNDFYNCTFRNAWRGISSYNDQAGDGGESYCYLDNCMVEDNTSVGVVIYHADIGTYETTIQDNAQDGLWLYDSPARYFYNTAITGNDTNFNYSNAMEVLGGSDVDFLVYNASVGYIPGFNRVANYLPQNQMVVDGSSSFLMGDASTQSEGDNGVIADSGSCCRIYNQGSGTVNAYGNWWGTASPGSFLFSGPVDYSGYLSYDPSTGAGVSSGNYPTRAVQGPQLISDAGSANESSYKG